MNEANDNAKAYYDPNVVEYYRRLDYLEPAETWLLSKFKDQLADMDMLDVAVGAGRTTAHFMPLVKKYVGVDISPQMIQVCSDRYGSNSQHSFMLSDMSNMTNLHTGSFDLILVSFNAISALNHQQRLMALEEFARVGRKGAALLFSSFNLAHLPITFGLWSQLGKAQVSQPKTYYWRLRKWFRINFLLNAFPEVLKSGDMPYAELYDGYHDYRLKHYYVTPAEQIRQLETSFHGIRVFARNGDELKSAGEMAAATDEWLFYFALVGSESECGQDNPVG